MDALLLCCAVVALASHGCAQVPQGYEPTTHREKLTHRRHDRAADDWLGSSVRDGNVHRLNLESQDIQRVPRAAFRNTPNVMYVYLNSNKISDVDVGAFEGVPKLLSLGLHNNDISSLPEAVFSLVPGLNYLLLSGNRIAELSPSHFAGLTRLRGLGVSKNRAQLQLHNRTFANLPDLWSIDLRRSNIRTLPSDVFTDSNGLTYIYLDGNKIEELDNSTFYGLTKLKELRLSGNRLLTLQPAVFDKLPSLETLDLSNNRSNYLSEENMHFRWSPTVNLTNNMIQYINPHVYNINQRVPTFILNNNPYHCCSSLLSFTRKYSNKGIQLPTLVIDKATCDTPAHLRGTGLSQLSEDSLGDCDTTPTDTPADSITTIAVPLTEAASTEIPTPSTEYPDTPTSDSIWPTPRPEDTTVTETPKHFSITTPPILSTTSSTPSPVTPINTLRDILSLIRVLPASPGSHRNGHNNIYISGPIFFFNNFNISVSPSSL